jgi:outer membrane protein OmpA-like peptidoglycan-associated protein
MGGSFRVTTWVAVADFFTAIAVISFALYASHRSKTEQVIRIQDDVRQLAERLRTELQRNGIPAETRSEDLAIVLPSLLFFESGKAEIRDTSNITKVAAALKNVKDNWRDNFVLVIQGYTDSRPPLPNAAFRDNLELSRWRAQAVEEQLDRNGVRPPQFQLVSQGMGANNPVVNNCLTSGPIECGSIQNYHIAPDLERNRRIELKFGVFTGNTKLRTATTNLGRSSTVPSNTGKSK